MCLCLSSLLRILPCLTFPHFGVREIEEVTNHVLLKFLFQNWGSSALTVASWASPVASFKSTTNVIVRESTVLLKSTRSGAVPYQKSKKDHHTERKLLSRQLQVLRKQQFQLKSEMQCQWSYPNLIHYFLIVGALAYFTTWLSPGWMPIAYQTNGARSQEQDVIKVVSQQQSKFECCIKLHVQQVTATNT